MYVPRLHSRRLLLPPGWVALGFLLLLGCQALLAHRSQIRIDYRVELAMPIPEKMVAKLDYVSPMKPFTKPLADIKPVTHWHTVSLKGRKLNDFVNSAVAATALRSIDAEITQAAGVKVCFQQGATNSNLLAMLDLVNRLGHPIYWLDIEHQPTTFYAVNRQAIKTVKAVTPTPKYVPFCIASLPEKYEPPIAILSPWQIAQRDFASLWQQPWRLIAILIATLAALSTYRLARPRPSLR